MFRALLTAALVGTALVKGVAIGVAIGALGCTCARRACRRARRSASPLPTETGTEAEA